MSTEILVWVAFGVFVLAMLALDLGVFHRKAHVIRTREALLWTAFWVTLALVFNVIIFFWRGPAIALEFLAGYLIEKSLSVDNIFVFLLIFTYFKVPRVYEHKVLFWGILGALVMRLLFITIGVALIERFHAIIYIFGVVLIATSIRMAVKKGEEIHPERNPVLRLFRRLVPITDDYVEGKFLVRISGVLYATPLLVVLLVVETTDLVFAVDSIPAIFAITLDPFIIYTSNVFAILGLRALYFALAGVIRKFRYLHYGLAAILFFVGAKMLVGDFYKIPIEVALGVIAGMLLVSIIASIVRERLESKDNPEGG
ncbi:MAG: TerC family protein [Candidatus Thermoplasmatota archaeon]|nr:TerC family protein [Candidatus Thermoplasmatota archaeon]